MGMFDYVKCEAPLPDGWKPGDHHLQTKDFDCGLETYVIRSDGRLIREDRDTDYHGCFQFYSYEDGVNDTRPLSERWHEYRAKFTDGRLVNIEVIPYESR